MGLRGSKLCGKHEARLDLGVCVAVSVVLDDRGYGILEDFAFIITVIWHVNYLIATWRPLGLKFRVMVRPSKNEGLVLRCLLEEELMLSRSV